MENEGKVKKFKKKFKKGEMKFLCWFVPFFFFFFFSWFDHALHLLIFLSGWGRSEGGSLALSSLFPFSVSRLNNIQN
jgi:hypothetical protein